MADYNLGRATGEINIGYDGSGLRRAQADMAATAAEAAALDRSMERVNKSFDENRKVTVSNAQDIVRARGEVEELRKVYQRQQDDYVRGQNRVREAAERARDVIRDQSDNVNALREAHNALNRTEENAERLRIRAADSYEKYHARLQATRIEIEKFNQAHVGMAAGMRNASREVEKMGSALESLTEKLAGVARIMGQVGLFGLFGGAAGGSLFATGAGGLQLLASAMGIVVEVAQSFAGALALLPAVINGAVLGLGTLAIAFHGVGAALQSIGDPAKFIQAIRGMAPAAQQVMLTIQSFTDSLRGARNELQQSLFAPIIADIQPMIITWLPRLMNAGKEIANQWGQAFHQVFAFFQTTGAQQGFQTFVRNLVTGFQAARGAIQPLLQAWNTLATVGSQVFPRLGEAIAHIATEFNNWIQRTSRSGELLNFINRALDGFTSMGHVIRDLSLSVVNIFNIFRGGGGATLHTLEQVSAELRSWTDSVKGQNELVNFFGLLHEAARAVAPQIHLLGQALAVVGGTLTRLGIAIGPGLTSFFTSFTEALRNLAPHVVQLAPAINQFLTVFGQTLQQIVTSLGPKLPALFQDMSDAFVQIMRVLPPLVDIFAQFLDHVTPGQVEALLGMVVALKLLGATLPVIELGMKAVNLAMKVGPFGLVATVILGLVAAGVLLYENWDKVKEKTNELTSKFGGLSGILDSLKRAWDRVTDAVSHWWETLSHAVSNAWNELTSGLGHIADNIINWFTSIDWSQVGKNIIQGVIDGMLTMLGPVGIAAEWIVQTIRDHLPSSPAKRGPFSINSPEQLGSMMVTQYAAGMIAGTPSVTAASSSVAGSASGIGSGGGGAGFGSQVFTSAGVAGKSGQDFSQGHSGFDQWVNFITKDLSAWNNIFRESFDLVSSIAGVVTNTIRAAANLINGGDNALTRPGGIVGPPLPLAQQAVPGVPQKPIPGVAPDQWGKDLAARGALPGQQSIPGVPSVGRFGQPTAPPPADAGAAPPAPLPDTSGVPPANPPASTTGAAAPPGPPSAPGGLGGNPTKQQVSDYIISKALSEGYTRDEANAFVAQAYGESTLRPEAYGGSTGDASGGASGIFQFTPGTWNSFGKGGDPLNAQQNIDAYFRLADARGGHGPGDIRSRLARISGGGPAVQGNVGIGWENAVAGAAPFVAGYQPPAAPPQATPAPATPTGGRAPERPGLPGAPPSGAPPGGFVPSGTEAGAAGVGSIVAWKLFKSNVRKFFQDRRDAKAAAGEATAAEDAALAMSDEELVKNAPPDVVAEAQRTSGFTAPSPADTKATVETDVPGSAQRAPASVNGRPLPPGGASPGPTGPPPTSRPLPADTPAPAPAPKPAPAPRAAPTPATPDVPAARGPLAGLKVGIGANLALGVLTMIPATLDTLDQINRLEAYQRAVSEGKAAPITEDELAELRLRPGLLTDANVKRLGAINTAPGVRPITAGDLGGAPNLPAGQVDPHTLATAGQPAGAPLPPVPPASTTGGAAPGGATSLGPYGLPAGYGGQGAAIPESAGLGPLSKFFNIHGTTYAGHQEGSGKNQGIDWWPAGKQIEDPGKVGYTREEADRLTAYAKWVGTQPGVGQVIYMNPYTGEKVGYHNGQPVGPDMPGTTDKGYYRDDWGGHTGHVHTLFTQTISAPTGAPAGTIGDTQLPTDTSGGREPHPSEGGPGKPTPPQTAPTPRPGMGKDTGQMRMPAGWDLNNPIPLDVRRSHGIPDTAPPMFYPAEPGTVQNVPVPKDFQGPEPVSPGGTISLPTSTGATPGFPSTNDQRSPLDQFTQGMQSVSSIAGDAFTVFQDVIESIGAAANITDTLVRGFENTETVVNFIHQFQTFIKTGADIAKLVGDVGGAAGAAGGASGMPGAGAPGAAIQAIAGIVQSALEATNAAITLGIDIYHEVGKYAGFIFGEFLGGAATGPLGGNVRMLLNTRTNQLQTYGEDNALNKNTFNVPLWQRSYTQQPTPPAIPAQVNIYTGPNQTPAGMMQESMWMVSTGAAPVASVAGVD